MSAIPDDSFVGQSFHYLNGDGVLAKYQSSYGVFGGHANYNYSPSQQHSAPKSPASIPVLLYSSTMDGGCLGLYEGSFRGHSPCLLSRLSPFTHSHFNIYECAFEPAFIQKRNERERQRVKCVNQGYAKLRDHLPGGASDKRLSKVETLRAAITYIKYLQSLVEVKGKTLYLPRATMQRALSSTAEPLPAPT
ncbi:hypothetical protein NHX12_012592 [Muraenolepis orangiensis]|uniref:BHLH domain-containing protein n=1 Tax=Muraenolepis orangiensis TaxID=630683 RepID=A0A9Q0DD53_9TELE|nr:hypothetical protein NHX12_012592 [Muraenolepis orangiensis]